MGASPSMSPIPLILVHYGNSGYLKPVIIQARAFNRNSPIYLLGDQSNNTLPFVKHYNSERYSESAMAFKSVYQHMSTNDYHYELFCLQRWFMILELVKEQNLEHFLYLDSNALLYCDATEVFSKFTTYDFTICGQHTPCFTFFSQRSLGNFCNYLMDLYTIPRYLTRFRQYYTEFINNGKPGGICDMFAFALYKDDVSRNIKELSDIDNEYYFDANMNEPDGFEMKEGLKKIYWIGNLPYGKVADTKKIKRFYGLHFQGSAKAKLNKYALNINLNVLAFY